MMKKRNCLLITSFSVLFAGCSSMMGPDSIFGDTSGYEGIYPSTGMESNVNNYGVNSSEGAGKPSPYSITPQDEANYQDLSNSLSQRVQQLDDSKIIKNSTTSDIAPGTSNSRSQPAVNADGSRSEAK